MSIKIPKSLADQAYKVIVTRHKREIKDDLHAIYKTLGRLIRKGISQRELLEILGHVQCEAKLAQRAQEPAPWA